MGNHRTNKEEIAEDFCFTCKDGGLLRVCDYQNCLKAYHPHCVGKEPSFLESDEQFICSWHICFICKKSSYVQCFCCPSYSVCRGCIKQAEFVQMKKQTKGFCNNCLRLAILIEKNVDVDSDGERVDFTDTETYEFLFKDYWEIVKDKEGLTLNELQEANALLKKGLNCEQESDSEKLLDEERISDEDFLGDNGDDESGFLFNSKSKSNKVKTPYKKGKSNKKTYVGWGSKELIGFLSSIGKDTSVSLDQLGVSEIVKDYIERNNLFQPDKKKKYVLCDDKLRSLFRKRKLKHHKIYSLLETHIAGNADSEDESFISSEDADDSRMKKRARTISLEPKIAKRVTERNKRCKASLVGDNIKLVYLKRSLIVDLLKHPGTFESKVIGCFVRVKNDLKDYSYWMSKKLYQLGQVTGVKKSPEEYKIGETCTDILLCVSNLWAEVKISMLSDDDFEEEECEDLRLLVKKGLFKMPIVAELDEKVRIVHGDIVSHWISRELVRLERLIEQANEKGWRRELFEYIDKRQLLRTSAERQRLIEEIPQVIPDTEDKIKDTNDAEVGSFEDNRGAMGQVVAARAGAMYETLEGTTTVGAACLKSGTEEKPKGSTAQGAVSSIPIKESSEGATSQQAAALKIVTEETLNGSTEQNIAACGVASEGATRQQAAALKVVTEETLTGLFSMGIHNRCFTVAGSTEQDIAACGVASEGATGQQTAALKIVTEETLTGSTEQDIAACGVASEAAKADSNGDASSGLHDKRENTPGDPASAEAQVIEIDEDEDNPAQDKGSGKLVIDLDADEDGDIHMQQCEQKPTVPSPEEPEDVVIPENLAVWHYVDPQGEEQGPFPMGLLRMWEQSGYFDEDFKVWRTELGREYAVLLTDAMRSTS